MVRYRIPNTSHYGLRKRKLASSDARKPFRFDLIPREVRNMIYDLVLLDSMTSFSLELTSWCPHWSRTRFEDPICCGLRLVDETWTAAGDVTIARTRLHNSTRNLNLLKASKWIWREAAPMLYGQEFKFLSIEALAHFLSQLRPEILGCLRHIDWLVCKCRDRTHRLHDVMRYLTEAPMLQTLQVDIPPVIYGQRGHARYSSVIHNQNEFLRDRARFDVQLGRYLAFCLYRNYYGMWMLQAYRQGGFHKILRVFRIRIRHIRQVLRHMLTGYTWGVPDPSGNGFQEPWYHLDDEAIHIFRRAFFAELERLLSRRQQMEDIQQASDLPAGRRTTRNSWKSIDHVAQAGQLPDFELRIP
ncbi:hypothetical protein VMCG_09888 [Cytospora schulzeri]|uniref:F-box domain-containing protein n=1 Tax=Cytospora schulzeri TaxID=448051 RepID=A0A423VE46_9PEZI|nr:hypothetical protein VMCG_09888 [Valsa malicola]